MTLNPIEKQEELESSEGSFVQAIKNRLPEWGPIRWTIVILALLILATTGVSLFSRPDYEVLYSPSALVMPSAEAKGIYVTHIIEVGNTGAQTQDRVALRFRKSAMDRLVLDVWARNFGVSDRPVSISTNQDLTIVDLGTLEPEKRVKVTFTLLYPQGIEPEPWEALFVDIALHAGKARRGDPGMTMVGRAWFTLFGRLLPF